MTNIAIYFAAAGLIISLITLYLTQFRGPKFQVFVGSKVRVYYPRDGGFGIYAPLTFINTAQRTGIIIRCAIVVSRMDAPQQQYYIEWSGFSKLSSSNLAQDEIAGPIAVPGRSSINKLCWFVWRPWTLPYLILKEGAYNLAFFIWTSQTPKPDIVINHELYISKEMADELLGLKEEKDPRTIGVTLDKAMEENKVMTTHERKALLGK